MVMNLHIEVTDIDRIAFEIFMKNESEDLNIKF